MAVSMYSSATAAAMVGKVVLLKAVWSSGRGKLRDFAYRPSSANGGRK
jgi:hypothetical protein